MPQNWPLGEDSGGVKIKGVEFNSQVAIQGATSCYTSNFTNTAA